MFRGSSPRAVACHAATLWPRTTTAFFVQSVTSFTVSLSVTIIGIGYLHDARWVRAFLLAGQDLLRIQDR